MSNYGNYGYPQTVTNRVESALSQRIFLVKVYGWMTAALMITAATAMYTVSNKAMLAAIFGGRWTFVGLLAQLALVIILNRAASRLPFIAVAVMFGLYSAMTGLTFSVIFLVYTSESITSTFLITAGTFGAMSAYGYVTKSDLTHWGNFLLMALIGLIIASVVNLFWASSTLYWITTFAGVLIFVGLTAYDTQKIKNLGVSDDQSYTDAGKKLAVLGGLTLYLDFINLFLYLLRLFGRRK